MLSNVSRVLRGDDWAPGLCECLPNPPNEMVSWMEQHTRLLKSDTYSKVGLLNVQGQPCCLKLYIAKSALQNIGFRFGYGRGVHSFDAASQLLRAGMKVPTPRTCVQVPEGILLLTQGVEDSCDLRALWLRQPTEEIASRYLRQAAAVLSALHLAGFAHGDAKWSNLLWSNDGFYLVDLEDVRRVATPGAPLTSLHGRQLRDIVRFTSDAERLGASSGQYATFLDSYCARLHYSHHRLLDQLRQPVAILRKKYESKSGNRCQTLL